MLEYFTAKKVKKHREEKAAEKKKHEKNETNEKDQGVSSKAANDESKSAPKSDEKRASSPSPKVISKPNDDISIEGTPILDHEDEKFLERLTSAEADLGTNDEGYESPPPLPPRVKTPVIEIDSDDTSSVSSGKQVDKDEDKKGKGKEKVTGEKEKSKRFSFVTNISRSISLRRKHSSSSPSSSSTAATGLEADKTHLSVPSSSEAKNEETDMARVLEDLDLSVQNNRAFSLSTESAEMVRRFTQVLKDLVNGVPTAYGDLVSLLDDRDGILARNYEKLPKSLKKLVAQLPEKLTSSLAPELLAVAAEAQGLSSAGGEGSKAGLKGAAKKFLSSPGSLHELVTKPGALVGLLKGIVNALKTRFPAFIGTNILWSLAVFLLLSMLWYCHKRGREERLEREASEAAGGKTGGDGEGDDTIDGKPRVEELPDDLQLPAPTSSSSTPAPAPVPVPTPAHVPEK